MHLSYFQIFINFILAWFGDEHKINFVICGSNRKKRPGGDNAVGTEYAVIYSLSLSIHFRPDEIKQ